MVKNLHGSAPDHVAGDPHQNCKSDVGNPVVAMKKPGDEVRRHGHQDDGKDETEHQEDMVSLRGTSDSKHIVQGHGYIGDDDQHEGVADGCCLAAIGGGMGTRDGLRIAGEPAAADITPHAPAHPGEQQSADKEKADDVQEFDHDQGEADAQNGCGNDADDDGPAPQDRGEAGHGHADHDGIVAGEDDVDDNDGQESGELGRVRRIKQVCHVALAGWMVPGGNMWQEERLHKGERMMAAPCDAVGRSRESVDVLELTPARHLAATFDRDAADLASGARLPCGWTLLYFLDSPPTSRIGRDGRTTPGELIPDTGLPRRMWAGGSFTFERDLVLGRPARQTITITGVERKRGRSGDLCFVTTEHRIAQDDQDAVIEVRNLVFRDAPGSSGEVRRVAPPQDAVWQRSVVADPVLLFRFSALTFNAHRIHYDVEYCRNEEAYPDLVVHGPMQALLLLDLAERACPERRIRHFRYRGVAPLFAPHPFLVCGKPETGGSLRLWIEDSAGGLATSAELEFT